MNQRVVVGMLLGWVVTAGCKAPEAAAAQSPAVTQKTPREDVQKVQVASAAVESAELPRTLELTGTLTADEQSNVATLVPGTVVETPVDVGDTVRRGDALLKLDDRDAKLRLQAAVAAVMQVRARLNLALFEGDGDALPEVKVDEIPEVRLATAAMESAKVDLDRSKKLLEEHAISTQQHDLARLKLDTAQSQVAIAKNGVAQSLAALAAANAQVALARKAVADMTVRAPFGGAVVKRNVSMGEYAAPQVPLLQLVKSETLRLLLDLPETAVGSVALGQEVEVNVQGTAQPAVGKVARISPAVDGQTRSLRVEARVDNQANKLRPGMFASARVTLAARDLALWVPKEAVLTQSGTSRVFVLNTNHVEERIVVVGEFRGGLVEIRGHLQAGDRVVVKNVDKLVDGAPVDG